MQSKVCEHNDTQVKETDLSEEKIFGKSKLGKDALNDASIKKGNLIPKSNFREGFTNKIRPNIYLLNFANENFRYHFLKISKIVKNLFRTAKLLRTTKRLKEGVRPFLRVIKVLVIIASIILTKKTGQQLDVR